MNNDFKNSYCLEDDCLDFDCELGFVFPYKNRKLKSSIPIEVEEVELIDSRKFNDDLMTIECMACKELMDFNKRDLLKGFWKCPKCGATVREKTAYNRMEKDNEEMMSELGLRESSDDIPEGCSACGGPYPDCISSCSMFDD